MWSRVGWRATCREEMERCAEFFLSLAQAVTSFKLALHLTQINPFIIYTIFRTQVYVPLSFT